MNKISRAALLVILGFYFGYLFSSYTVNNFATTMKEEPTPVEVVLSNDRDMEGEMEHGGSSGSGDLGGRKDLNGNTPSEKSKDIRRNGTVISVTPSHSATTLPKVNSTKLVSSIPHPRPGSVESFQIKNLLRKVPKSEVGIAIRRDMKRYVCNSYGPRLGNLMFLYATCYGVAYDYNLTLTLTPGDYIYPSFEGIPKPTVSKSQGCRGGTRSFNQIKPRYYNRFDIRKTDKNVRLNGYLQSWKYFANSFDDLKQQFTWKKHIRDTVNALFKKLVNSTYPNDDYKSVVKVGIHIRRGDYVYEKRPMADKPYIESAKQYFLGKYPKILFIVATTPDKEAKTWCMSNIINGTGKSVLSGQKDRFVDMALLSMTDHLIISTGTYGWWAGFLSNGTVVHYDWIPPNHYKFNREDYILPYWVGIKATNIDWKNSQFRTLRPPPPK